MQNPRFTLPGTSENQMKHIWTGSPYARVTLNSLCGLYVAKDDQGLWTLLLPLPKDWDGRSTSPCLIYLVLEIELCVLSPNWAQIWISDSCLVGRKRGRAGIRFEEGCCSSLRDCGGRCGDGRMTLNLGHSIFKSSLACSSQHPCSSVVFQHQMQLEL